MSQRRYETVANLAFEFGVSRYTIMRDIHILCESFPIYTMRGPAGGVYFEQGCTYDKRYPVNYSYLSEKQEKALIDIINGQPADIIQLQSILVDFKRVK